MSECVTRWIVGFNDLEVRVKFLLIQRSGHWDRGVGRRPRHHHH